jgi:hypothetical protein
MAVELPAEGAANSEVRVESGWAKVLAWNYPEKRR